MFLNQEGKNTTEKKAFTLAEGRMQSFRIWKNSQRNCDPSRSSEETWRWWWWRGSTVSPSHGGSQLLQPQTLILKSLLESFCAQQSVFQQFLLHEHDDDEDEDDEEDDDQQQEKQELLRYLHLWLGAWNPELWQEPGEDFPQAFAYALACLLAGYNPRISGHNKKHLRSEQNLQSKSRSKSRRKRSKRKDLCVCVCVPVLGFGGRRGSATASRLVFETSIGGVAFSLPLTGRWVRRRRRRRRNM